MKDLNPNELIKIIQTLRKKDEPFPEDIEIFIETYACYFLETLYKSKSSKEKRDNTLIELIDALLARLKVSNTKEVVLRLPDKLKDFYLNEMLFISEDKVSCDEYMNDSFSNEILKIGDEWIRNIKAIYTKINIEPRDFYEAKLFWTKLCIELKYLTSFSLSDEFLFITKSLRKAGKLSTLFTLQHLISDTKVLRLCERFNRFFKNLDVEFLNVSIDEITISEQISSEVNCFVENSLNLISQINIQNTPRIIRRSLSFCLNRFRDEILKNTLLEVSKKTYELFNEFNILTDLLNNMNEKDSAESRILIDKAEQLTIYMFDLYQITQLFNIQAGFLAICELQNICDSSNTKLMKTLGEFGEKLILIFKNKIKQNSLILNNLSDQDDFKEEEIKKITTYEVVHKVIEHIARIFTDYKPRYIENIVDFFNMFNLFIQYEEFNNMINKSVDESARIFLTAISKFNINSEATFWYNDELPDDDILSDFKIASELFKIQIAFEKIEQFFKYNKLLNNQIEFIRNAVESYCSSLPDCVLNYPIFIPKLNCNIDKETSLNVPALILNENSMTIHDIKFYKCKTLLIDEDSELLKLKNTKLISELRLIKPKYLILFEIFEQFHEINNEIKNGGELNMNIVTENSVLPNVENFERLLIGLVNLKWKYFKESMLEEIQIEFLKINEDFQIYNKVLQEIFQIIIPKLLNDKKEVNLKAISSCLLGLDDNIKKEILNFNKLRISNEINMILKEMIKNGDIKLIIMPNGDLQDKNSNGPIESETLLSDVNGFLNKIFSISSELIISKIMKIYKIAPEVFDFNNELKFYVQELLNSLHQALKILGNPNGGDITNDVGISSLVSKINSLYDNHRSFSSLDEISLFEINFSKPNFKNLISTNLKFLNEILHNFHISLVAKIQELPIFSKDLPFYEQFSIHSKLNRFSRELLEIVLEISKLGYFDEKSSENLSIKLFHKLSISLEDSNSFITSLVMLSDVQDDKFYENLKYFYNLPLQKTLSDQNFKMILKLRNQFDLEIKKVLERFNNFKCDDITFVPLFNTFKDLTSKLQEDVEDINVLLCFYKFKKLEFSIDLSFIEEEFYFATKKQRYLEEHFKMQVKNNPISCSLKEFPDLMRTEFGNKIKKMVADILVPIKYIPELSQDFMTENFFDQSILLGDYLANFNEDSIKEIIEKAKCSYKITNYLAKDKDLIKYKIEYRPQTKAQTSNKIVKIPFIANFTEYKDHLNSLRLELDVIYSFNKYKMCMDQLESIENGFQIEFELSDKLENVQNKILEFFQIFKSDAMDLEKATFKNCSMVFSNLILNLSEKTKRDAIDECVQINVILDRITDSIKSSLNSLRSKCNKLYFISNDDLLCAMSDESYALQIIKRVFNISELIVEDNEIIGVKSHKIGREKGSNPEHWEDIVMLRYKVHTSDPIYKMVNEFQFSLQITSLEYFIYNVSNSNELKTMNRKSVNLIKNYIDFLSRDFIGFTTNNKYDVEKNYISTIDELIHEFKYFNTPSFKTKTHRIKKIEELALEYPDMQEIYPKPLLNLGIDENIVDLNNFLGLLNVGPFQYEFEYYEPTNFIFTSLTARIFANIILCKNKSGMILYGPSGTGKTESVKYFCRTIGKPLFIFCCNEKCNYELMKNIIIGCTLTGNFICFDEFNRLKKEVMSAVTELIFDSRDNIKVFLTMNLGYKGRSELPKSLKSIFGEVFVDNPDIKDIILYHSNNIKLFNLIEGLKKACNSDETYDFGLRAIKSIFMRSTISYSTVPSEIANLIYFYMATFNDEDRTILISKLKEILEISLQDLEIDFSYSKIFKSAIESRNGILVLGKSGKSRLISNMFEEVQKNSVGKNVLTGDSYSSRQCRIFRYNPINILIFNETIFGTIDKTTKEWVNSIFLTDLKTCLHDPVETWFVFDGPILSEWIEDFNSILDDNRILCLSSGEILKIPFCFKFIFETNDISQATPATLTRLYVIKIVDERHNTQELLDSSEASSIESGHLEHIESLHCTKLLPNQIDALNKLKNVLKKSNVVIFKGYSGSGKKTVLKWMDTKLRCCHSSNLVHLFSSEGLVYIENFENASMQVNEQVRVF